MAGDALKIFAFFPVNGLTSIRISYIIYQNLSGRPAVMSQTKGNGAQTADTSRCMRVPAGGALLASGEARLFSGLFFMRHFRYFCGRLAPATGRGPTRTC